MTQRKWLAECHAWLDAPGSVQFQSDHEIWYVADAHNNPIDCQHLNWRIRPSTITINGSELPKPVPYFNGAEYRVRISGSAKLKEFCFNTREDRDLVYAKLVEVLS